MPAAPPECPRCGYDLSGIVSGWGGWCPLDGVCPECGGALRWADVLVPRPWPPSWHFEWTRRPTLRTALATLLRLLEPLGFFARAREHPEPRPLRVLALFLIAAILGTPAACMISAWLVSSIPTTSPVHPHAITLAVDCYRDAAEPVLYLAVWMTAALLVMHAFWNGGRGVAASCIAAAAYVGIGLVVAWHLLAVFGVLDLRIILRGGPPASLGGLASNVVAVGVWLWMLAACGGLAAGRLPLRRRAIAWLASQAGASLAIVAFSRLDEFLPF